MTKGTPLTEEEIIEAEQAINSIETLETTVDNVETL